MVQRKGTQKTSLAVRVARFQCRYGNRQLISWLTSEGAEEEKQTGKQRSPWHCYHQPLTVTRSVEDSSTITVRAGNVLVSRTYIARPLPLYIYIDIAQVLRNRGKGLAT